MTPIIPIYFNEGQPQTEYLREQALYAKLKNARRKNLWQRLRSAFGARDRDTAQNLPAECAALPAPRLILSRPVPEPSDDVQQCC